MNTPTEISIEAAEALRSVLLDNRVSYEEAALRVYGESEILDSADMGTTDVFVIKPKDGASVELVIMSASGIAVNIPVASLFCLC